MIIFIIWVFFIIYVNFVPCTKFWSSVYQVKAREPWLEIQLPMRMTQLVWSQGLVSDTFQQKFSNSISEVLFGEVFFGKVFFGIILKQGKTNQNDLQHSEWPKKSNKSPPTSWTQWVFRRYRRSKRFTATIQSSCFFTVWSTSISTPGQVKGYTVKVTFGQEIDPWSFSPMKALSSKNNSSKVSVTTTTNVWVLSNRKRRRRWLRLCRTTFRFWPSLGVKLTLSVYQFCTDFPDRKFEYQSYRPFS